MEVVENEQQTLPPSMEAYEDLDWDGLLYACKEKEEQLNLAGACGLKLHEQLIETQMYIDEMRMQHEAEMEVYITFKFYYLQLEFVVYRVTKPAFPDKLKF